MKQGQSFIPKKLPLREHEEGELLRAPPLKPSGPSLAYRFHLSFGNPACMDCRGSVFSTVALRPRTFELVCLFQRGYEDTALFKRPTIMEA